MKYLLDTNTCIRYLNQRSDSLIRKLRAVTPADIVVCSVTRAELFFGAAKSQTPEVTLAKQRKFLEPLASLPFDDQAAAAYAHIRAQLETQGTLIGPNDLLIAAIAQAHGLIVVTHNVREFSRVNGIELEDWEASG